MSSFISKSACRGRRPASIPDADSRKRPHITAHLLKDRSVARFVVAPEGYGKTSAASEYAETVFAWVHVFWINCQSPCFIRELDAGLISQLCREVDPDYRLVVFDNVPLLDATRAESFSTEIDAVLHESREVILTCAPTSDVYAQFQRDRLMLSASDLLLNDEELDGARTSQERVSSPAASFPASKRIPMLVWDDSPEARVSFLKKGFAQEMPGDLMLALSTMHVLGKGSLDDLRAIGSPDSSEMADVLDSYPHMCYDCETGRFESPSFAIDEVAQALKKKLDKLVEASSFATRDELVKAWADIVVWQNGSAARACDIVRVLCPLAQRPMWMRSHTFQLVKRGCFYSSFRLIESMRSAIQKAPIDHRTALGAMESVCLHMLGDETSAVRVAKRYAFDSTVEVDAQICCLLVITRDGSELLRRQAALTLLELLEKLGHDEDGMTFYEWAAHAQCSCFDGPEASGVFWVQQLASGACADALYLSASWLFKAVDSQISSDGSIPLFCEGAEWVQAESYVHEALDDADAIEGNFFVASAGLSLEQVHERGVRYSAGPLPTAALLALRRVEMSILSQRRQYELDMHAQQLHRSDWAKTHPDSLLARGDAKYSSPEGSSIPMLSVKLFGRFEVAIGDLPIGDKFLKRQNSCTLLALLAINHGREVVRESLARAMWPKSDGDVAKKNFYTVWSELRRALTLPDGTCPYLVRHQYGCSLEMRYVQCDAMRFDEICRELLFGEPDFKKWPALYSEIERDFSGELMPGDMTNAMLQAVRSDYRLRLVDALVSAATSITDAGNAQWGIWFARAAANRDSTREDAYLALMRAQIAADQRTAAMLTYLRCRRSLSEELGMDPSPEAVRLYESLLGSM